MRALKTSRALCVDLELSCWNGPPPPGMRPEVIEIGLVEVDMQRGEIIREAEFLVRPVLSTISEYCTELTGITAEEVARDGRPLGEVLRGLTKEYGPAHKSLVTWGNDWPTIEQQCRDQGVENPFPAGAQINIGQLASLAAGQDRRIGLQESLATAGIDPGPIRHRGLADARNTGRLLLAMSEALRPMLPGFLATGPSLR